MTLAVVIGLIVFLPIALVVIVRKRKLLRVNPLQVLREILGAFLLVGGFLMLFVALAVMFNEKLTGLNVGFLVVSLALVLGGFALTKGVSQRSKTG